MKFEVRKTTLKLRTGRPHENWLLGTRSHGAFHFFVSVPMRLFSWFQLRGPPWWDWNKYPNCMARERVTYICSGPANKKEQRQRRPRIFYLGTLSCSFKHCQNNTHFYGAIFLGFSTQRVDSSCWKCCGICHGTGGTFPACSSERPHLGWKADVSQQTAEGLGSGRATPSALLLLPALFLFLRSCFPFWSPASSLLLASHSNLSLPLSMMLWLHPDSYFTDSWKTFFVSSESTRVSSEACCFQKKKKKPQNTKNKTNKKIPQTFKVLIRWLSRSLSAHSLALESTLE